MKGYILSEELSRVISCKMSDVICNPAKRGRGRPPKAGRKVEEILMAGECERVKGRKRGNQGWHGTSKVTVGVQTTDKCAVDCNNPAPVSKAKAADKVGNGRKVKAAKSKAVTCGKEIKPIKPPPYLGLDEGTKEQNDLNVGGSSSVGDQNKENLGDVATRDNKDKIYRDLLLHDSNGDNLEIKPFYPRVKKIKFDIFDQLPPLPLESDLFLPPVSSRKGIAEECSQLLAWLHNKENHIVFDIDQVAAMLDADVKKLFLCCNVLESVLLMTKTGVNSYMWHGRERMERSLQWLRELAEKKKVLEQLYRTCQSHSVETSQESQVKEKLSVGVVAQKLLMIFLVAPEPKTLTISVACEVIYGRNGVRPSTKSKITDVSNILMGAGLLRRVCLKDTRQPELRAVAFQYLGGGWRERGGQAQVD